MPEWEPERFLKRFSDAKAYLLQMNAEKKTVETFAKGFGHFYTLWALVVLKKNPPPAKKLASPYAAFMQKVQKLADQDDLDTFLRRTRKGEYALPLAYFNNARGASTDLGPRRERLEALEKAVMRK